MIINKCFELATESIPGCVLQLYVWLTHPDQAGSFALASITISALTTGYTSAMIAFDKDVDARGRIMQPQMYGYIPDDNGLRGRCFVLMTMISTLHNLSRSVGCAVLAASNTKMILTFFVAGEITFYIMYKAARGDFIYFPEFNGAIANYGGSFANRFTHKIGKGEERSEQATSRFTKRFVELQARPPVAITHCFNCTKRARREHLL